MAQQHHTIQSYTLSANATPAIATLVAALTAQSGIDISHGEAVTCVVSALTGQKIVSGTMRCYVYMPTNANPNGEPDSASFRWMPYSRLDYSLVGGTVARDEPIGDKQVLTGVGRIIFLPDAVTFDGGATASTCHTARRRRG
jgi:hypothetical protein